MSATTKATNRQLEIEEIQKRISFLQSLLRKLESERNREIAEIENSQRTPGELTWTYEDISEIRKDLRSSSARLKHLLAQESPKGAIK